MRQQVGAGAAPAFTVFLGYLKHPGTLLFGAVEIIQYRDIAFPGGIQKEDYQITSKETLIIIQS